MRQLGLVCLVVSMFAVGAAPSGAPQRPGTYEPIPLTVTVHARDSLGVPCGICGDAADSAGAPIDTVYTNGDQGVEASIDKWGNLIIDFQTTKAQIRGLVYDYTNDPANPTPAPPGTGSNQYLSTIGGNLGLMLVGEWIDVASCPLYDDELSYRHSFYRDCQSGLGSVGSPLRVTRISATTWEVETTGPARVFGIATKGRAQVQDFGEFSLPFKMTLTAQ